MVRIQITGNQAFSDKTLHQQMEMRTVSGFARVFLRKKPFLSSNEILQSDIANLTRFYQTEGFLHARIDKPELKVDDEKQRVEVTLKIFEGEPIQVAQAPQWRIANASHNGASGRSVAERWAAALSLQAGARFRDEALRADHAMLSRRYANAGYPYARIEYRLTVEAAKPRVDIAWLISPGALRFWRSPGHRQSKSLERADSTQCRVSPEPALRSAAH